MKLSIEECATLESLLQRAIANEQFQMCAQTLGHDPVTGEDNVELFMGNGASDDRCEVISVESSGEEPIDPEDESKGWSEYTRQEIHLFIPQDAIDVLAGEQMSTDFGIMAAA